MGRKHIVVVGAGSAGLGTAIRLKERLGGAHDVTVFCNNDYFVSIPSLVWVPFGRVKREDIVVPHAARFAEHGVRFRKEEVNRLDLERHTVIASRGIEHYDYLVIATGAKANHAAIPGLGARGHAHSITTLPEAERDGKYHKLEVQSSREGVRLRARAGYIAEF